MKKPTLPIILASQSPARKRLLKRAGFTFQSVSPDVDEDSFKKRIRSPRKLVETLAQEKARAVAVRFPNAIVIGSDQMLVLGQTVYGKPRTAANAVRQLMSCAGQTVSLLTAVCVRTPEGSSVFTDETRMTFRKLTRSEAKAYVELDRPLECAGSFMFEKAGITLFERVETHDPTAIEGLPVMQTSARIRHALGE